MRFSSYLAVGFALALNGCVRPAPKPSGPPPTIVQVRIVDSLSGDPLVHAAVQTMPWSAMKNTDSTGTATLRGVATYSLVRINCPTWRLPLGPHITERQLHLEPGSNTTITIRVATEKCLEKVPSTGRSEVTGRQASR